MNLSFHPADFNSSTHGACFVSRDSIHAILAERVPTESVTGATGVGTLDLTFSSSGAFCVGVNHHFTRRNISDILEGFAEEIVCGILTSFFGDDI